jgi:hypothetical protein
VQIVFGRSGIPEEIASAFSANLLVAKELPVPGILKLFSAWLIVMFPVVLGSEALYLLLVDDWSLGMKDPHAAGFLTTLGFFLLVVQHVYRIVTILALLLRKRFAIANARVYLTVSLAMVVAFVALVMDAWMILVPSLAATVTWWLVLYQSKKVRAFESQRKQEI